MKYIRLIDKIILFIGFTSFCFVSTVRGDVVCSKFYDGTAGSGVIESSNYPFDYDNNERCTHRVILDPEGFEPWTKKVCLTFERFRLDTHQDFFEVNNTYFLGDGTYPDVFEGPCRAFVDNYVDFHFNSNYQLVNTGFKAKFQVLPLEDIHPGSQACQRSFWRCPNGTCIPASDVCDGQDDCGDFSDESYAHARCFEHPLLVSGMVACDFSEESDATCRSRSTSPSGWQHDTESSNALYGPSKDHTGGDTSGFYKRTVFQWNGPKSFIYVLNVGNLESSTYCLSFWYHMKGKDPGALRVFWGSTDYDYVPQWSRIGNHGNQWHHGQLERDSFQQNVDPHFEVKRGGEIDSQIALDDISIMKGPCHIIEDVSCTFEGSFCGWTPRYTWSLQNSRESDQDEPTHDSTGNSAGQFATLENFFGSIQSPTVTPSGQISCFSFFIYTTTFWTTVGTMGVSLIKTVSGETQMILSRSLYNAFDWQHFTVDVPAIQEPYQMEISLSRTQGSGTDNLRISLDEISLIHSPCSDLDLKTCAPDEFRCDDKELDRCIPAYLKCNGESNCQDGSDEEDCPPIGTCQAHEFRCANSMCIPYSYKCNGRDDCGDFSDEANCSDDETPGSFMGSFTVAAVASIVAACILLIVVIFAKVFMCYYKRRPRTSQNLSGGVFQRRGSSDSTLVLPPPTYDQCADNLATYPKPAYEPDLPSYDLVEKEQYVQITVPIENEIQRMKDAMASRNNSLANSCEFDINLRENVMPITPPSPPITGAAALMSGGSLVSNTPVVSWEPAVHRPRGRSYRKVGGHINRGFSGSELSIASNEDRSDEYFSTA